MTPQSLETWRDFAYRVLEDNAINFGNVSRRRVRILVPRDSKIDAKDIRDLCISLAASVEELHGKQRAISVMVYTDLFSVFGIIGSWDLCPGGQWRNAVDDPGLPRQWVVNRGIGADMMLKLSVYFSDRTNRSSSQDGGNVEGR